MNVPVAIVRLIAAPTDVAHSFQCFHFVPVFAKPNRKKEKEKKRNVMKSIQYVCYRLKIGNKRIRRWFPWVKEWKYTAESTASNFPPVLKLRFPFSTYLHFSSDLFYFGCIIIGLTYTHIESNVLLATKDNPTQIDQIEKKLNQNPNWQTQRAKIIQTIIILSQNSVRVRCIPLAGSVVCVLYHCTYVRRFFTIS